MRSGERLALAVILGSTVLVGGTAGATAYAWHRAGSFHLAIHENGPGGDDLKITIPGLFINAAIAVCPVPTDAELRQHMAQIRPVLRAVSAQLASMPDAVLVDVQDGDGAVRIEKSGPNLMIRVASPDERVEIAVPVESVRRLVAKLDA